MKTSKLISILTTATTVLLNNMNVLRTVNINIEDGDSDETFESVTGQNDHLFISYPAGQVREMYDSLDDHLKTDEASEAIRKLFPHMYEDDLMEMRQYASTIFHFAHDLSQERSAARTKFGFAA
jgi:hypothetical protein